LSSIASLRRSGEDILTVGVIGDQAPQKISRATGDEPEVVHDERTLCRIEAGEIKAPGGVSVARPVIVCSSDA